MRAADFDRIAIDHARPSDVAYLTQGAIEGLLEKVLPTITAQR